MFNLLSDAADPAVLQKRTLRSLRFLLLLAVVGMAYATSRERALGWRFWMATGLFFVSNVVYHFERTALFSRVRLPAFLFLFDLFCLSFMMIELGESSNEFFILFAVTVLMAAIARSVGGAFLCALAVGALYTMMTLHGRTGVVLLSTAFLTRLTLFFVFSIFAGFMAHQTDLARRLARASTDFSRALFDSNPGYVLLCDREGVILDANPAVEADLGVRSSELRGRPLPDFAELPASWRPPEPADAAPVSSFDFHWRRRDGTRTACRATVSVAVLPGRSVLLMQAHRESAEVAALREAVVRADRMAAIGQLVAGVAHELNNALTSVIGFSQILVRKVKDPELSRHVQLIAQEAHRASHVVRNLLVFSRRHVADRTLFSLNDVVSGVVELKSYELRARRVEVTWSPDAGLPWISGNPYQIGQVVLNLINNAQQAIEANQAEGRIVLRTGRADGRARLDVEDDGPGLSAEVAGRLFEPFVTTKRQGTGLGLNVSRTIVREHGGDILFESPPGRGARFRVELPLPADVPAASTRRDDLATTVLSADVKGLRVLVIEDEPTILEMIVAMLRSAGVEVDTSPGGRGVAGPIALGRYDVVLCDLYLRDLDGMQVYALLREMSPGSERRLIFMTGNVLSPATRVFIEESGSPLLEKPFDARKLLGAVWNHAERQKKLDAVR